VTAAAKPRSFEATQPTQCHPEPTAKDLVVGFAFGVDVGFAFH
jgi:hypothetical protein